MFELEKAVEQWRSDLRDAGIHEAKTLEELEGHLREQFNSLAGEMRPELAFELATHRLGPPDQVRSEFAKTEWRLAAVAWQVLMICVAGFCVYAGVGLAEMMSADAGEERSRMIVSMLILASGALGAALLPRFLPQMKTIRARQIMVWGPAAVIAAIVMLIGTAGDRIVGKTETEELRGILVLLSVCLLLLSVSVNQLCADGSFLNRSKAR